jgi:hypothetical protein
MRFVWRYNFTREARSNILLMSSIPSNNNDFTTISIKDSSNSYPPNSKLYCNLCNCNLILLDPQKEEWYCSRCKVSYFPNKGEKVKRPNKFETPGPLTDSKGNIIGDKMPVVSMINDEEKTSSVYKPRKLPPSLEERLKRPGVNLLSYNTSED